MISAILYDGSFKGLLTAIFLIYEHKLPDAAICKAEVFQPSMFGSHIISDTDDVKAARVLSALKKKLSPESLYNIFLCYLSEQEDVENIILAFIRLALSHSQSIEHAYGHSFVLKVSQLSKMVRREKHRMEAFIRFRFTKDDIYFAIIEPDFNVIPVIAKHFKNRYADQKWIIYDVRRNYGIYYDLENVAEMQWDFSEEYRDSSLLFNEEEEIYQILWRDYFKHVNIPARKNMKLHLQHVPKRYWKYLTEKGFS